MIHPNSRQGRLPKSTLTTLKYLANKSFFVVEIQFAEIADRRQILSLSLPRFLSMKIGA